MNTLTRIALALAAIVFAQGALAQMGAHGTAYQAVKVAEARRENAALMHHYTWNTRTEIIVKGEVKDTRIEQVQYGAGGELQHNLLNDHPADASAPPLPIGFLIKKAVAAQEKQELEKFLHGMKTLLQQYTLPTTGKILDFLSSATPSGPDARGLFQLSGFNVVQPGDNLSLWVNPWTRHLQRAKVSTTFQGAAVELDAHFQTLHESGLNYVAFAEATVPAKQLSVKVQNYNYARLAY
ncbi:MAG: hypothetical protein R3357_01335 [Burkholderiales bacterium]|nr:hypothetical protein [Burkholderiales bacterium]